MSYCHYGEIGLEMWSSNDACLFVPEMANGEEVLMMEGFLCPICKADLGTAVQLLAHFQEEHTDEQDLLKSFKGELKKRLYTRNLLLF